MTFTYSIDHIDFNQHSSKKSILLLLKEHDEDTFLFSYHTAQLNVAIAKELGESDDSLYLFFQSGMFHDIGKLGMSEKFINYPGAYTIQMYKEMKKHAEGGADILRRVNAEKELINTANFHHCNFDGSGYPGGLFYWDIPLHARITRISDSIDAYMSKRCYKDGGPTNAVLDDLMQYKKTSYDPEILEAFSKIHNVIMSLSHKDGNDHPSQKFYMHYLTILYGDKYEQMFKEEFI